MRLVVVGGGLAGLMAALKASEAGACVNLFALGPCKRSHSACAQGGINAALDTRGEGDTPEKHFEETIYGGDFLADQTPVKRMCDAAPDIIHLLDRMGVMFNRTSEGLIALRRLGGTLYHRVAFAGSTTGQQLLYALDEQVRRQEVRGLVVRYEGWEFLSAVLDADGVCRGIVAQDTSSMRIATFPAEAVVMATGGPGALFGRTTNSVTNTGYAATALYRQGAHYANAEFIQIHPTAIPGLDKNRLISESVRGEGGRVWTYRDGKRWYFLEEWYPEYGNLVPRDVATRAIFRVCVDMGLGVDGRNAVYLDMTHMDPAEVERRLAGILDIYKLFTGDDPRLVPMKIFPAVHYSMGGLWVDPDHMTNVPGLFAAGECEYQYHGGNRLGGNGLLSAIHGGMVAGSKAVEYMSGSARPTDSTPSTLYDLALRREEKLADDVRRAGGDENAYRLHEELGELMTGNVTVVRHNYRLEHTLEKLVELKERHNRIDVEDTSGWSNQSLGSVRRLGAMLDLAYLITCCALRRNESRGAHYKPDYPERNDSDWLKTTIASYDPGGPVLHYEPVDLKYMEPRERKYG